MMDIASLKTFFMWCTILNGAVLVTWLAISSFADGWVYRMHRKWYPMERDTFIIVTYSFSGLYKIFFLTFNLAPYLALVIMD